MDGPWLEAALDALEDVPGLRHSAFLDPSGRILVQRGFTSRQEANAAASLAAALHATGGRLSRLIEEDEPAWIHASGDGGDGLLIPLPLGDSTLLLLLALEEQADAAELKLRVAGAVERLTREVSPFVEEGVEAQDFEASLNESLDRLFPGGSGEGSV